MGIKNKNIELAYEQVEKKVIFSKSYVDFIARNFVDNKTFETKIKEIFMYDQDTKNYQVDYYEYIQIVEFMKDVSKELGIENDFYYAILNGCKDNNVIDTVINTKLVETKYGNPFKMDFTCNDVIFSILETIFGLDILLVSIRDKNILIEKFNKVLVYSSEFNINSAKDCEDNYVQFYEELNNLYKNTYNMTDYEEIKEYIKNNCNGLIPFVLAGLSIRVRDIVRDENGSYNEYDTFADEILDLFNHKKVK